MQLTGNVGIIGGGLAGDGTSLPVRQGPFGEIIISELRGRFYEQNRRGTLYRCGITSTSISNATFTLATLDATATPIIGLVNPIGSGMNAVILQATLGVTQTALQATGPGAYVWASGLTTVNITTGGTAPMSCKTLLTGGSVMKNLCCTALTALTPSLVIRHASSLGGGSAIGAAFLATQAGAQTVQPPGSVENFDGSLFVPPGGVLGLLASVTPVGHSAVAGILWDEIPIN